MSCVGCMFKKSIRDVGWLVAERPSNMLAYVRDEMFSDICRFSTL